ncbi:MAG TPA: hypothetical protein VKA84_04310 [Gemmatimonadaceae bacterium]|nr:hypothetical protein [Gemmatimonadaceae bacterium]
MSSGEELGAERGPPFSLTLGVTEGVERALEAAVLRHDASMRALRGAIEACVVELHGRGMPPEAVLVTMKAFVRHTAVAHPPYGQFPSSWAADVFMDDIVRWAILAYYRSDVPPDSSGRYGS